MSASVQLKFMSAAYKDGFAHLVHLTQVWKKEGLEETVEPLPFLTIPEGLPCTDETMEAIVLLMEEFQKAEGLISKAATGYLIQKEKLMKQDETDDENVEEYDLNSSYQPLELR